MAAEAPLADLCPKCCRAPITDDITGWCSQCADSHMVESYWQKDEKAIEARRDDWKVRSQSAAALRERQHKHRLIANTRPRERAHRDADPLEIASEALEHLRRVRHAIGANVVARQHLDEAEEGLKMLAWGPQDDGSRTETPSPAPSGGFSGHPRAKNDTCGIRT